MKYKIIVFFLLLIFMVYGASDRNRGFISIVKSITNLTLDSEIPYNKNSKKDIDSMLSNIDSYIKKQEFPKAQTEVKSIVMYGSSLVTKESNMYDMMVYIYLHKNLLDRLKILKQNGIAVEKISIDRTIVKKALDGEKLIYKSIIEKTDLSVNIKRDYMLSVNSYMDIYRDAIENNSSQILETKLHKEEQNISPHYQSISLAFLEEMLKSIKIDKIIKLEYANRVKVSYLILLTLPSVSNISTHYHSILNNYEKFQS